jgi:hypothetical protein
MELFDLLDVISGPATWRRVSGPLALVTALRGLVFRLEFFRAGSPQK